jgi:hypothetical protein
MSCAMTAAVMTNYNYECACNEDRMVRTASTRKAEEQPHADIMCIITANIYDGGHVCDDQLGNIPVTV